MPYDERGIWRATKDLAVGLDRLSQNRTEELGRRGDDTEESEPSDGGGECLKMRGRGADKVWSSNDLGRVVHSFWVIARQG